MQTNTEPHNSCPKHEIPPIMFFARGGTSVNVQGVKPEDKRSSPDLLGFVPKWISVDWAFAKLHRSGLNPLGPLAFERNIQRKPTTCKVADKRSGCVCVCVLGPRFDRLAKKQETFKLTINLLYHIISQHWLITLLLYYFRTIVYFLKFPHGACLTLRRSLDPKSSTPVPRVTMWRHIGQAPAWVVAKWSGMEVVYTCMARFFSGYPLGNLKKINTLIHSPAN